MSVYRNICLKSIFDNEIESIRFFDIATKRTIKTVAEAKIIPASDILFSKEEQEKIKEILKQKEASTNSKELKDHINEELLYLENSKERHLSKYYALLDQQFSLKDYMKEVQG